MAGRWAKIARRGLAVAGAALLLAGCGASRSSPPPMALKAGATYTAVVATNYGSFTIHLFATHDPVAVNSFVYLADRHFFNGDKFFRIIRNFVIQTGDPQNVGTGGPGYHFNDELPPTKPYAAGIVAMANAGPNTNGSQFFICTGSGCAGLPQSYTELGEVTKGMSVVNTIAALPVTVNPVTGEDSYPVADPHMTSVTIQVSG